MHRRRRLAATDDLSPTVSPEPSFRNALRWSYVMDGSRQGITMVVTLMLAGILGPRAFGTVAMATVYVLFVQMLLQQGMVPALIQRKDLHPQHLDTAFWMVTGSSAVLALLSVALSGPWAALNDLPDLQPVIIALSLLIPLKGLVVVQEARLRRQLRFRPLAIRTTVAVLAGGIVGIAMALRGVGIWALVAQQLTTGLVEVVVLWSLSGWRPSLRFSGRSAKELLSFSTGSSLASLGVFVNNRADAVLIGLFFGPVAVGLYRFASRWVDLLIDVSVRSLQAVSLPALSRHQDQRDRFDDRLLSIFSASALLALPALGVLAASSDALMALVGPEWAAAATPMRILCGVGAVRALILFNGPMLQALGRTRQLAMLSWITGALSALGFVVAGLVLTDSSAPAQVSGMAVSRLVLYGGVFLVMNLVLVVRVSGVALIDLARATGPPGAAAMAAIVAVQVVNTVGSPPSWAPGAQLVASSLAAACSAICVLMVTDQRSRTLVKRMWLALNGERGGDAPPREVGARPGPDDAGSPAPDRSCSTNARG